MFSCARKQYVEGKIKARMSVSTFQIGSKAQPLEILFGPSHYDKGQKARSIKVYLDDKKQVQEFKDMDDTLVHEDVNSRAVLRLKIWQNAKVSHISETNKILKVDELHRGDKIVVKAKPYYWSYEGIQGVSLTCSHLIVTKRGDDSVSQKWL
jgi:hypothetical protein